MLTTRSDQLEPDTPRRLSRLASLATTLLSLAAFLYLLYALQFFGLYRSTELELILHTSQDDVLEVTYKTAPNPVPEPFTRTCTVKGSALYQKVRLSLPRSPITDLGISPAGKAGRLLIRELRVRSLTGSHRYRGRALAQALTPDKHITEYRLLDGELSVDTPGRAGTLKGTESLLLRIEDLRESRPLRLIIPGLATLGALLIVLGRIFMPLLRIRPPVVSDMVLALGFVTALALPGVLLLLQVPEEEAGGENRILAQMPVCEPGRIFTFSSDFERFFGDRFGLRRVLIRLNNRFEMHILRISPLGEKVMVGKNRWLFYSYREVLSDIACTRPLSADDLEQLRLSLEAVRDSLLKKGARFYVLIAPNKHSIYPEHLPPRARRVGDFSRLDQLESHLRRHSDLVLIDVRETFMEAKQQGQTPLYHRTDTHWNDYGAFLAQDRLMAAIRYDFPQIDPLHLENFTFERVREPGGDLAEVLALADELDEEVVHLVPKQASLSREAPLEDRPGYTRHPQFPPLVCEHDAEGLPRALILRDSFGNALIPYLSEYFSRSVFVWSPFLTPEIIAGEKPDLVILELVERNLEELLDGDIITALFVSTTR